MKSKLLRVGLRKNAIILPPNTEVDGSLEISETTSVLLANCTKMGYTFSEDLLHALNHVTPLYKLTILELLQEVTGVNKNWTPLVKQWNIPTDETIVDHIITWFANVFQTKRGAVLSCGHLIPPNTFPLERYNGCPFCGTPFELGKLDYDASKNKLKILRVWTFEDLKTYLNDLLCSPVSLDAAQVDDLKILIDYFGISNDAIIKMKETRMLVIDALVACGKEVDAGKLFSSPNDIMRYLWYKHTGFLQVVEPRTILNRKEKNERSWYVSPRQNESVRAKAKLELKLKYGRAESKLYATWLNNLSMPIKSQCENMHPKRGMWVRFIRALRLAEYSKRKGFENLAELLDVFYNQRYEVWQGKLEQHKMKSNAEAAFLLLKQRPGLFARSLFSTMLWYGPDVTVTYFKEVLHQVPARLVYTLSMYAEVYFDKNAVRTVKPLGGTSKKIPTNKMLQLYSNEELIRMQNLIQELCLSAIKLNLASVQNRNKTIFIDQALYKIPIAIGDRNENLQDFPVALMGTRFDVEGETVRLFLQWGEGLPAQHLDMDLSCKVVYDDRVEFCSYSQLVIPGCKHSGDIQRIPSMVGTAEYIDVNIEQLESLGAKYVSFTCNAYTGGSLSPNLVVGWMNSKYPMAISPNGVAYDPSNVQQQIRVGKTLQKGLVFGVLDVAAKQIIWLELSFGGQIVQNLNVDAVEGLLTKLDAKLKIGELLALKAEVQDLEIVDNAEFADEVYETNWALNTAQVSKLFL